MTEFVAQSGQPFFKPAFSERKRAKGKKLRAKRKNTKAVRPYCFDREMDICRCCRFRRAQSLNEEPPRSCGGKVSKRDSHAICGDGVNGCHGYVTRNEIEIDRGPEGSEGVLGFTPKTKAAAEWMRLPLGTRLESPPTPRIRFEEVDGQVIRETRG